ncbi:MAG: hypothetical protein U0Q16_25430 [Bryobacteraceae bacterium]
MRTAVRMMAAGQQVTVYRTLAGVDTTERLRVLDDLAREARSLGLYDRNVPFETEPND